MSNEGDLLIRHRRRCQGPKRYINRRKACNACVKARAKCCYTRPACLRCVSRGTECIYSTSLPASAPNLSQLQRKSFDVPQSSPQLSSSQTGHFANSTLPFELDLPAWDFSASPYSLESFDMTMQALANPPPVTLPGFTTTQPSLAPESPEFTPSTTERSHLVASKAKPALPLSTQSLGDTSSASTLQTSSSSITLARIISEYPSLLLKGSFVSPFLHLSLYSLYSNVVPDMTYLPQTSMAICCGGGLNISENKRFFRRALDAARQRLIGSYVGCR